MGTIGHLVRRANAWYLDIATNGSLAELTAFLQAGSPQARVLAALHIARRVRFALVGLARTRSRRCAYPDSTTSPQETTR